MLKQISYNGVPIRSHIDPILRKYIWVDERNKKYIKEKKQFRQVTKYKGQYVIKKQNTGSTIMNAGSTSQKGGKINNTCNNPNANTFYYKTQHNNYDVYFVYHKYGIDASNASNRKSKNGCKDVIINNTIDTANTFYIFKIYKFGIGHNEYKLYYESDMVDDKDEFKKIKKPILEITMIDSDVVNNKRFYIRFESINKAYLKNLKKKDKGLHDEGKDIDKDTINNLKKYFEELIKTPAPPPAAAPAVTAAATTTPAPSPKAVAPAVTAAATTPAAKAASAATVPAAKPAPATPVTAASVPQPTPPEMPELKRGATEPVLPTYATIDRKALKNTIKDDFNKLIESINTNKKKKLTPIKDDYIKNDKIIEMLFKVQRALDDHGTNQDYKNLIDNVATFHDTDTTEPTFILPNNSYLLAIYSKHILEYINQNVPEMYKTIVINTNINSLLPYFIDKVNITNIDANIDAEDIENAKNVNVIIDEILKELKNIPISDYNKQYISYLEKYKRRIEKIINIAETETAAKPAAAKPAAAKPAAAPPAAAKAAAAKAAAAATAKPAAKPAATPTLSNRLTSNISMIQNLVAKYNAINDKINSISNTIKEPKKTTILNQLNNINVNLAKENPNYITIGISFNNLLKELKELKELDELKELKEFKELDESLQDWHYSKYASMGGGGQYKQIPINKNAVVNKIIKHLILIGSIHNKSKRATQSAKAKSKEVPAKAKAKSKEVPAKAKAKAKAKSRDKKEIKK